MATASLLPEADSWTLADVPRDDLRPELR